MAKVSFDRVQREALSRVLVKRLRDEFDLDVAPMDGQRLLDMLADSFGAAYYNQGLRDAQAAIQARVDDMAEAIAGLEMPEPR